MIMKQSVVHNGKWFHKGQEVPTELHHEFMEKGFVEVQKQEVKPEPKKEPARKAKKEAAESEA